MKPGLLIIANRKLHSAPRVIREIETFKNDFNIIAIGQTAPHDTGIEYININSLNASFATKAFRKILREVIGVARLEIRLPRKIRTLRKLIKERKISYVIVHETEFLPFLAMLKKQMDFKLILNAHEYYPLEFEEDMDWMRKWKGYYEAVYRTCLKDVDLFVNVCETIRNKCLIEFNKDSIVIPNAASYAEIDPKDNRGHNKIRMIYHGNCNEGRRIEEMIRVAQLLGDGYSLDLMLAHAEDAYSKKIISLAEKVPNLNIIPPVPFKDIIKTINAYDLGIYILAASSFNNTAALPNKFFEYIQAGLCVAVSPNPEMKRITNDYSLGVVSDDFSAEALAAKIKALSKEDIFQHKLNSRKAAQELSAERYSEIFLKALKAIA